MTHDLVAESQAADRSVQRGPLLTAAAQATKLARPESGKSAYCCQFAGAGLEPQKRTLGRGSHPLQACREPPAGETPQESLRARVCPVLTSGS